MTAKKWLIHLPNNPGDVVMALFVVAEWHKQRPQDELHYLVDAECLNLVEHHPQIKQVWVLPRALVSQSDPSWAARGLDELIQSLSQLRLDGILNLYQGLEGALLLSMVPAAQRLGLQTDISGQALLKDPWSTYLFAIPAARHANALHVIDVYRRIAGLSKDLSRARACLPPCPVLKLHSRSIALQIGSAWPGKRWPLTHFAQLCQALLAAGHTIELLGAPSELAEHHSLIALDPDRVRSWAGSTTLSQVGDILKSCQILITGDTFAMHAATAIGCPVLALFGPSSWRETGPYARGAQVLAPKQGPGEDLALQDTSLLAGLSVHSVLAVLQGQAPQAGWLWLEADWFEGDLCWRDASGALLGPKPPQNPWEADLASSTTDEMREVWSAMGCAIEVAVQSPSSDVLELVGMWQEQWAQLSRHSIAWECYALERNALDWRNTKIWLQDLLALHHRWSTYLGINSNPV